MPSQSPDRPSGDLLMEAIQADDASSARHLLDLHPELKARINEPIDAFDSPPSLRSTPSSACGPRGTL